MCFHMFYWNLFQGNFSSSSELNSLQLIMSSMNLDMNEQATTSSSIDIPSSSPSTSFSSSIRARRKSSETALLKINRRVISKPKKNDSFKSIGSTDKEIETFYLNNKLTSQFRQTALETIIEEEADDTESIVKLTSPSVRFLGSRKLKRRISFTDCLNVPKTVVQNRRKKIKKLLGRKLNFTRLSMDAFYSHLKSLDYDSNESQSDVEYSSDKNLLDKIKDDTKKFSNEI